MKGVIWPDGCYYSQVFSSFLVEYFFVATHFLFHDWISFFFSLIPTLSLPSNTTYSVEDLATAYRYATVRLVATGVRLQKLCSFPSG